MLTLRSHEERPGDDLAVHQDFGGGDVAPLQRAQDVLEPGPPQQQTLEVEAGHVGAIAVMPDVHVPNPLERGVAGTGDEAHPLAHPSVRRGRGEQRVVSRLVNQVSRQHHGLHAQQDARDVQPHGIGAHQHERHRPPHAHPQQHQRVRPRAFGFSKQRCGLRGRGVHGGLLGVANARIRLSKMRTRAPRPRGPSSVTRFVGGPAACHGPTSSTRHTHRSETAAA